MDTLKGPKLSCIDLVVCLRSCDSDDEEDDVEELEEACT
jgi:hypothetical protein